MMVTHTPHAATRRFCAARCRPHHRTWLHRRGARRRVGRAAAGRRATRHIFHSSHAQRYAELLYQPFFIISCMCLLAATSFLSDRGKASVKG